MTDGVHTETGVAFCHPDDEFDAKLGFRIAEGRARKRLEWRRELVEIDARILARLPQPVARYDEAMRREWLRRHLVRVVGAAHHPTTVAQARASAGYPKED